MPAAAPVPRRHSDDMAQNGPSVPQIPMAANESAASSREGIFKIPAAAKPAAPIKAETATCHRRSLRRSELFAIITIPNEAATYGIALTNPTSKSLKSENDRTI